MYGKKRITKEYVDAAKEQFDDFDQKLVDDFANFYKR